MRLGGLSSSWLSTAPIPLSEASDQYQTDTLQKCSSITYPNLMVLLKIALTLPITSCESERRLIKTARRSTMTELRLSSLALLKINRDRCNNLSSEVNMRGLVKSFAQLPSSGLKPQLILCSNTDIHIIWTFSMILHSNTCDRKWRNPYRKWVWPQIFRAFPLSIFLDPPLAGTYSVRIAPTQRIFENYH